MHANVAYSRAQATIMDRNHAAQLFFSLAIEQSNEEAIWAWMLSSPHIEIKHRVSCSGHAILSGVLSMRGLVTARQAFTPNSQPKMWRARPVRHGSARVYTTITNRADPCWPGYKCSCKRGISLMNKARETQERHTDKFHNSMLSLGFEPPNHGVAAIVTNHWPRQYHS